MNKTVKLIVVTILALITTLLSIDPLLAKGPNQDAIKADYVLKVEGKSPQVVTIWKANQYLAVAFNGQDVVGFWQNWDSSNPTFYQVYPKDAFRIEFSRMESQQQADLLMQLRQLVMQDQLAERIELHDSVAKELHLSTIEEGQEVTNTLNSWSQFVTYDYADIGDNEVIPELARLIHQGFVRNF